MESFMQVFSLVKECCKEDLNEIAYKCWISPIEPYRMDDNTAILLVKESYSKQIIEKQYVGRLKEAFTKVFGFDVDVKSFVKMTHAGTGSFKRFERNSAGGFTESGQVSQRTGKCRRIEKDL